MHASADAVDGLRYSERGWSFLVERCGHADASITHIAFAKRGSWKTTDPRTDPDDTWFAYGGSAAEALMFMHYEVEDGQQLLLA